MKKDKFYDINEWIPINDFDDKIYSKSGDTLKILEVKPINFKLKSEIEQMTILESYRKFLKQCNFNMQIIIEAFKTNIDEHLNSIEKYSCGNDKLKNIKEGYIKLVNDTVSDRRSITRRFFIIIKVDGNIVENVNKIVNCLSLCGNEVLECDNNTIEIILKNYFCKKRICDNA